MAQDSPRITAHLCFDDRAEETPTIEPKRGTE